MREQPLVAAPSKVSPTGEKKSLQKTHGHARNTHSSMHLCTNQPRETAIDWTALQQLGWRFMQEVANKFNCFSLCTQKSF